MNSPINKDVIKGKWREFKGSLKKAWADITDDEWEKTKGEVEQISGIVQQKYGSTKGEISHKLNSIYNDFTISNDSGDLGPETHVRQRDVI